MCNKLPFMGVVGVVVALAAPASAADFLLEPPARANFASRFTWTGCYLGAHVGGAFERKSATDPVLLVQDNATLGAAGTTAGTTTSRVSPTGAVIGGQIGCDYQFAPSFLVGAEAAVSAGTMRGTTSVPLPQGLAGESALVTGKTDFIPSITARFGYVVDHWLLYGKGGVAWTNDKYSVTGAFNGAAFNFQGQGMHTGWTAGAGVEWAFATDWSARLEYDYYDFGRQTVTMNDAVNGIGTLGIKQTTQAVKLGLNFHVGQ